jgi:hypothetical protein
MTRPFPLSQDTSARVQIVRFVRIPGRIGRFGRNDLGQRWVTSIGCRTRFLRTGGEFRRASCLQTRFTGVSRFARGYRELGRLTHPSGKIVALLGKQLALSNSE